VITRLELKQFKNFRSADLKCGPFTVLIGTNASGKSNLRDAFRFLHGIGRGYRLAEIFGEKYEAGTKQWRGIRGGITEIAFLGSDRFELTITLQGQDPSRLWPTEAAYSIRVEPLQTGRPRVAAESLHADGVMLYETHPENPGPQHIKISIAPGGDYRKGHTPTFIADQPVLSQILDEEGLAKRRDERAGDVRAGVRMVLAQLRAMRFLDLSPTAMREPSFPGQPLGDRGENLSSALYSICEDDSRKCALTEWVRALTPMDAQDFEFGTDQVGRVLVTLVESSGHRTSAYSASDGTLRFLAIAAALLGTQDHNFYFFEELENGIHPTRMHLLLGLIESSVSWQTNQVMATTHSPQLLRLVSPDTLEYTSLVYRLEDEAEGRIQQLTALPSPAIETLEHKDRAKLFESGWLEDAVSFLAAEGAE